MGSMVLLTGVLAASLSAAITAGGESPQQMHAPSKTLWQIGVPDGDTLEFALAPGDYRGFERDAFYVVGTSEPDRDWPYAHPGPDDWWAGRRTHTFTLVFGLRAPGTGDSYHLVIDLADTQSEVPPEVQIYCNGEAVTRIATPAGESDRSIEGEPGRGREHQIDIEIPPHHVQTGLNRIDIRTVSGSWMLYDAIRFEGPEGARIAEVPETCFVLSIDPLAYLVERGGQPRQPALLDIVWSGVPLRAECRVDGAEQTPIELIPGRQQVEVYLPRVEIPTPVRISVLRGPEELATVETTATRVRQWEVHLLHFTHVDIGYTDYQEEIERLHVGFIERAMDLINQTDGYPEEARFRWLPEQLWAVESFLRQADESRRKAFIERARSGRIGLCGLYGNALTGLYSGEELFALVDYATRLRREHGIEIDSAMLTDVPGCSWGMVPVLAQSGVRYLSMGPNPLHRIGWTRVWDDRPFYWVSPSGEERVLCWMSGGYGWFRSGLKRDLLERPASSRLLSHLAQLERDGYPYDLLQMRYDLYADNGPPDPELPDIVRQWNERIVSPKLIISTPGRVFRELERRYGDQIPEVRGDFTPYWEDGAGSTAADTAVNRAAAERLVQAQSLWAMLDPSGYPGELARRAWRNAVLYDEHTWGAWNSISDPDSDFAMGQAARKQQFALDADVASRELLEGAISERRAPNHAVNTIEVFNTASWDRTDLVVLAAELDLVGDAVTTADGTQVCSQRLSSGELAFLAVNVPALGSARYTVHPGPAPDTGKVRADGPSLSNGLLSVAIDEQTGALTSLRTVGLGTDLVDGQSPYALNDYVYIAGRDPTDQRRIGKESVELTVMDRGPLLGAVRIVSDAPGARSLTREIRLIDGLDRVDITDTIDKLPVREKEGVHFAFPFRVPDPEVTMDMAWAVVHPERDQIEGACRNFFTIQRWVDISNADYGVAWATVDAPLVQLGQVRTDVENPFGASDSWLRHAKPSSHLFSYVMNNYWETNYKADQGGPATFRYSIRPHRGPCDVAASARFGIERTRPLIAVPANRDGRPALASAFTLDTAGVIVTSLRPSRDRKACIARLYAASGARETVHMTLSPRASAAFMTDADESCGEPIDGQFTLPAYGIALIRIEYR